MAHVLPLEKCILGAVKTKRGLSQYDLFILIKKSIMVSELGLNNVLGETVYGYLDIRWALQKSPKR